ncbi:MAG: PilZ domain-containing protein [Pseudomonadota bacterium]
MNSSTPGQERRKFYRINDVVMLRYEVMEEPPGDVVIVGGESGLEVSTGTLLAEIDRELNQTINTVWQDYPVVAQALGLLNRKVSIIAAQAIEYEQSDIQSYDDTMVNISGCGVAFESREGLAPDTRLRLSVILRPSQITLSIAGTVVGCEERLASSTMPYWIRVDFDDDVMAQEQLIQHVVQKQGALLSEGSVTG